MWWDPEREPGSAADYLKTFGKDLVSGAYDLCHAIQRSTASSLDPDVPLNLEALEPGAGHQLRWAALLQRALETGLPFEEICARTAQALGISGGTETDAEDR